MGARGLFVLASVAVLAVGLWSAPAVAQVPCGATITTDTTLTPSDPVVFDPIAQPGDTPCLGTAITFGASFITLDCSGLTIRGSGSGRGIRVPLGIEGVTILNCVVERFGTGIRLRGRGSHTVVGSAVTDNADAGLESDSDFNSIVGTLARGNRGPGFRIAGVGSVVSESVALQNAKAGFIVNGRKHFVDTSFSILNGGDGFVGTIRGAGIAANDAIANGGHGFLFDGGSLDFPNDYSDNKAIANRGNGILVKGLNPDVNVDSGGNRGLANGGPIQCQIAGQPCQ